MRRLAAEQERRLVPLPEPLLLDPDVAANLELAWAKLHLQRLVASYEKHVEGVPALEPEEPAGSCS